MRIVVMVFVLIGLSGCATRGVQTGSTGLMGPTGPEKKYMIAASAVKQKKYNEAVAAYKKVIVESPGSPLAADALYEIALVNALHDNPQKDFAKASQTFQEFIRRYPDNNRTPEAKNWIVVLKAVQDLKKENELLTKSIEELKQLDIRHEERRGK